MQSETVRRSYVEKWRVTGTHYANSCRVYNWTGNRRPWKTAKKNYFHRDKLRMEMYADNCNEGLCFFFLCLRTRYDPMCPWCRLKLRQRCLRAIFGCLFITGHGFATSNKKKMWNERAIHTRWITWILMRGNESLLLAHGVFFSDIVLVSDSIRMCLVGFFVHLLTTKERFVKLSLQLRLTGGIFRVAEFEMRSRSVSTINIVFC